MKKLFLLGCLLGCTTPLAADELRVAVATNFIEVMKQLATDFEQQSGHRVLLSSGATGKLYAQIKNEAPFALFFAADEQRPQLLEQEGIAVPGSRFTYALGKLVLWSPDNGYIDDTQSVLKEQPFRFLSIANPATAPYGRAAREVLEKLGLWDGLQGRMVRGENIGQAYQYVYSRNAQLGFVAKAQVYRDGEFSDGSYWQVPDDFYSPIVQQAVLLQDTAAARALLEYVRSPDAIAVIESYGYGVAGERALLSRHE
ncbi:molybdate ABC transporter substrate-binding protein [Zobellella maritima]|uniref:molybdate ABC transporter substrate-binding protein n=1 Tax=Zobellella maritima TaxID=2059725 RepID=UPI000E300FFB|nr:molybdate ABC transporter substrate-binding protein [Zobellella maritima]